MRKRHIQKLYGLEVEIVRRLIHEDDLVDVCAKEAQREGGARLQPMTDPYALIGSIPPPLTPCTTAPVLSSLEKHRRILTKEGSQMKQILTFTGTVTSALLFSAWAFAQYQPPVIPTVPTISDIQTAVERKAEEERGKAEGKVKGAIERAEEKSKKAADKAAVKAEQAQKKAQQETEKARAKAERQKQKAETKAIQTQGKVKEQIEKAHDAAAGHIEKVETKTSKEIEKAEKKLLGEGK